MSPTLQQSQEVCAFNMRYIIQNSARMLRDNKLVRKNMHNFAQIKTHKI